MSGELAKQWEALNADPVEVHGETGYAVLNARRIGTVQDGERSFTVVELHPADRLAKWSLRWLVVPSECVQSKGGEA